MKIHVVRSGETIWDLAQKYNTPVERLVEANPGIGGRESLDAGMKIRIPTGKVALSSRWEKTEAEPGNWRADRFSRHNAQEGFDSPAEKDPYKQDEAEPFAFREEWDSSASFAHDEADSFSSYPTLPYFDYPPPPYLSGVGYYVPPYYYPFPWPYPQAFPQADPRVSSFPGYAPYPPFPYPGWQVPGDDQVYARSFGGKQTGVRKESSSREA
jgi:LysM repeat protein